MNFKNNYDERKFQEMQKLVDAGVVKSKEDYQNYSTQFDAKFGQLGEDKIKPLSFGERFSRSFKSPEGRDEAMEADGYSIVNNSEGKKLYVKDGKALSGDDEGIGYRDIADVAGSIARFASNRFGNIKDDISEELQGADTPIKQVVAGAKSLVPAAGQAAGFVGDLFGEGLSQLDQGLTGGAVGEFTEEKLQNLMSTGAGQAAVDALGKGSEFWGKVKKKFPEAAQQVEGFVNVGLILPSGKLSKAAMTGVRKGASSTGQSILEGSKRAASTRVGQAVAKPINYLGDKVSSLTDSVKGMYQYGKGVVGDTLNQTAKSVTGLDLDIVKRMGDYAKRVQSGDVDFMSESKFSQLIADAFDAQKKKISNISKPMYGSFKGDIVDFSPNTQSNPFWAFKSAGLNPVLNKSGKYAWESGDGVGLVSDDFTNGINKVFNRHISKVEEGKFTGNDFLLMVKDLQNRLPQTESLDKKMKGDLIKTLKEEVGYKKLDGYEGADKTYGKLMDDLYSVNVGGKDSQKYGKDVMNQYFSTDDAGKYVLKKDQKSEALVRDYQKGREDVVGMINKLIPNAKKLVDDLELQKQVNLKENKFNRSNITNVASSVIVGLGGGLASGALAGVGSGIAALLIVNAVFKPSAFMNMMKIAGKAQGVAKEVYEAISNKIMKGQELLDTEGEVFRGMVESLDNGAAFSIYAKQASLAGEDRDNQSDGESEGE